MSIRCLFCDVSIDMATNPHILFPSCKHGIHVKCLNKRETPQECIRCQLRTPVVLLAGTPTTNDAGDQKTPVRMPHTTDPGIVRMVRKRPLQQKMSASVTPELDLRSWINMKRPSVKELLTANITMDKYMLEGGSEEELEQWKYKLKDRQQWAKGTLSG